jgi:hypothetical protein
VETPHAALHDAMKRFGTQPLQVVANQHGEEHPATGNGEPAKSEEVTIN